MEKMIETLLKDAPNVAALLIMCFWFLRALAKSNDRYEQLEREHAEARAHTRTVIEANTAALARVAMLINQCEAALSR